MLGLPHQSFIKKMHNRLVYGHMLSVEIAFSFYQVDKKKKIASTQLFEVFVLRYKTMRIL